MGYDMSVVDEKGESIGRNDCDDPTHGDHYWRRSIFSGGSQAEPLVEAGMAYWPRANFRVPAKWPEDKEAEFGEYDEDTDECPPLNEAARNLRAEMDTYLKATYDERPGIAAYKLCQSNDGWWVTKAECESALKLWEAAGKPDVDQGNGDT